jgi:DNA polymerase-3 subunit alpha
VIESLIKCGAFDSTGSRRRQLMACYEEAMDQAQKRQRERSSGQTNLLEQFEPCDDHTSSGSIDSPLPDFPEWDHKELLAHEKETIGFYITGHPLSRFSDRLPIVASADSSTLSKKSDHETVSLAGVVSNIREVTTRRKETMAYVTLEDLKGSVTAIFFPEVYRSAYDLLHGDEPLLIRGALDVAEDSAKLIAAETALLASVFDKPFNSAYFTVDVRKSSPEDIEILRAKLRKFRGKQDGFIRLLEEKCETVIYLGDDMRLDLSPVLKKEVEEIIGTGAAQFM